MTSFLSLPPEVRDMIYAYALTVDGPIRPYAFSECKRLDRTTSLYYTKYPSVNLLGTCHKIHNEASQIVYSKNHFYLPSGDFCTRFFANALHSQERRSWIKSITLAFTRYDISELDLTRIEAERRFLITRARQHATNPSQSQLTMNLIQAGKSVHSLSKQNLITHAWPRKASLVLENLALDTLEVVFQDCYCPENCCYLPSSALATLTRGFAHGLPKEIRVDSYYLKPSSLQANVELWTGLREKGIRVEMEEMVRAVGPVMWGARYDEEKEGRWRALRGQDNLELIERMLGRGYW